LAKGWTHARLFPEPGLRPFWDLDLFVPPARYEAMLSAYRTIASFDVKRVIDLHTAWVDLPDRTWNQIWERSRVVAHGSSRIRILGAEDDLRLSCHHLLRHAVEMPPRSNPLWLCDVGAMIETLPADFDWDYCLSGQPLRTDWMLAVIRLANQVLGARTDRCPGDRLPAAVPAWMEKAFLQVWGQRERYIPDAGFPLPFIHVRKDMRKLPRALAERWPNPLQSVCRLSWPMRRGRLAQVVDFTERGISWAPRHIVGRRKPGAITA
jgi:hypothetical protein